MRNMSKRERRVARAHMVDIDTRRALPVKGVIHLGGGMNAAFWMDEASMSGHYVERDGDVVTIR